MCSHSHFVNSVKNLISRVPQVWGFYYLGLALCSSLWGGEDCGVCLIEVCCGFFVACLGLCVCVCCCRLIFILVGFSLFWGFGLLFYETLGLGVLEGGRLVVGKEDILVWIFLSMKTVLEKYKENEDLIKVHVQGNRKNE